jgi:hypothetical protein
MEHENQPEVADESKGATEIEYSRLDLEERRLETERLLKQAELRLKERDQRINKLQIWIPVITIVVSVVSSIVASVITSRTALATQQIDSDTQIRLDQNKYDFSREERKDKRLSENIPKLLSSNESEKKTAKATIVFFYPNEAKNILDAVGATISEAQQEELKLDPKQVEAINNQAWGIVIGGDTTLTSAQGEVKRAKDNQYDLVRVYYRQNYYRPVIGGFSDRESAERANISVSAKIRGSSYVVNLNSWCPNPTKVSEGNDEYWQCSIR